MPSCLAASYVCEEQEQLEQDILKFFYPDRGDGDRATLPPLNKGRPH